MCPCASKCVRELERCSCARTRTSTHARTRAHTHRSRQSSASEHGPSCDLALYLHWFLWASRYSLVFYFGLALRFIASHTLSSCSSSRATTMKVGGQLLHCSIDCALPWCLRSPFPQISTFSFSIWPLVPGFGASQHKNRWLRKDYDPEEPDESMA